MTVMVCMLLMSVGGQNIGNRALNQRQGVPCEELKGLYPGGVSAVRRGNRCFVASPSGSARSFGRTLSSAVRDPHPHTLS